MNNKKCVLIKASINNLYNHLALKMFTSKVGVSAVEKQQPMPASTNMNAIFYNVKDPKERELIKVRRDLYLSLKQEGTDILDYNKIYEHLMQLIKVSPVPTNKSAHTPLDEFVFIFLEKNIQMFSIEQMIKIFGELGKNNVGTIAAFSSFQYHLTKKLMTSKHLLFNSRNSEENLKNSQLLYYYFSIISELSMMDVSPLNFVLEFFATHSDSLLNEDLDAVSVNNLYNFIWYTSISIASILEKRDKGLSFLFRGNYMDTKSPVLSEKGARSLMKILNHVNEVIEREMNKEGNNFSENTSIKVRLFKALYYLKRDGLDLPENLERFLTKFQPFYQMQMETSIKNSALENTFENILKNLNLPYEKEKKLPHCSADFYVRPEVCVEVNGPQHYVLNSPLPVARDFLKKRTLELENYQYIPIHYKTILEPKKLIPLLSSKLKHLGSDFDALLNEAVSEIENMKKKKMNEVEIAGQKLEKRLRDSKYLV